MPEEVRHGPSHVGIIAHVAALRHGRQWLDSMLGALDANRRLLGELLARHLPAVEYREPEGTYLAWLDCRALDLADDPAALFLDRGARRARLRTEFGTGGAGHVRLNIATSPEILGDAVARMAAALDCPWARTRRRTLRARTAAIQPRAQPSTRPTSASVVSPARTLASPSSRR